VSGPPGALRRLTYGCPTCYGPVVEVRRREASGGRAAPTRDQSPEGIVTDPGSPPDTILAQEPVLQKPSDGVGRRHRIPRPARRAPLATRARRASLPYGALGPRLAGLGAVLLGRARPLATAERALPIAVAAIVALASLLTLLPGTGAGTAGAAQGTQASPRLAVNGGVRAIDAEDAPGPAANLGAAARTDPSFQPFSLPAGGPSAPAASGDVGSVAADGTLVTGYAPDSAVEDGSALIEMYRVRKGDTLSTIAARFHVSMMTLWWANKSSMKSKTDLHVGQLLKVPPVSGLVVTVGTSDTLDSLAAKYRVDARSILDMNQLTDPTLVVGQVLVVPGAIGAPIPTPKPTKAPVTAPRTQHASGGTAAGIGGKYTGGRMLWPVRGGGNYISQHYHTGHWALDIAADYGTTVVAAAAGRVTFAGWKNNGGGWQVWVSHGGNLYTTYNHMSAVTVSAGESVARGEQVGRVGQSGDATGPHLHFEVWVGPIWNGGQRVNPLGYL